MPLNIRILRSGNISVSITGQQPFITAIDRNVLDVKYLSFRSDHRTALHMQFGNCLRNTLIVLFTVRGEMLKGNGFMIVKWIKMRMLEINCNQSNRL